MFVKRLAVVAGLMLCTVSLFASNFRGADQVYLPVAGKLAGGSGTFITDVFIANLSGDVVSVNVIYQPLGEGGGNGTDFNNAIILQAFERRELVDFFTNTLNLAAGFGMLIFNACLNNADCTAVDDDGFNPNFREISVQSRVYAIPPGGGPTSPTTGQLLSGIPWYHFVSMLQAPELSKVFITGLTQNGSLGQGGTFRANVGVANASYWSQTTLKITAYQGRLRTEDKKAEVSVTLGPLGSTQKPFGGAANAWFPTLTGSNYFVVVEQTGSTPVNDPPDTCTQGCPAFLAYGSVLDNVSSDATTMESQYLIGLDDETVQLLYPSGGGKTTLRRSARR